MMCAFKDMFSGVDDPREANARYHLSDVLLIALAALLSGCETCADMAVFGQTKRSFLNEIMELPHGTPSHDTFSRVFRLIDPAQFEPVFARFAARFGAGLGEVVAIDGKALRGAYARGRRANPLHTVSLWATQARLTLATMLAPGRNEVRGVLDALKLVDLTGATVTADALHCRADVTAAILAQGGDYCITLKANQPKLADQATALLDACPPDSGSVASHGPDLSHDRHETRSALVVPASSLAAACKINGIAAIGRVTCLRQPSAGAPADLSTRLYILSRMITAEDLLTLSRAHWGIENHLHHVLDVTFREDACRSRKDNGPINLASLRRIALNLVRCHPDKASLRIKIKKAAWNDQFLTEVLAHMR